MENKSVQFAAAYIRVSTDDQTEYSPDAQRKALQKWAGDNGYVLPSEYLYVDEGISGRIAEKRPAFMRMIAAAKSKEHPFDVILVHKFDRFARSREDSVVYKSLLRKECGVRVISITESIDDDKFSIILEAMLEAMAEYYSLNLAEEVKKGMTEKAIRGERQCVASFGYRLSAGVMLPDPVEAPLVREMFQMYIHGMGQLTIAKEMNARGVRTHRGSQFENRTVEYIIKNPVYIGKLRWNPSGRTRRDYTNKNIILTKSTHEPLIDQETWDAAQLRTQEVNIMHKYHGRPNYDRKHWLAGIVRCATCSGTLVFTKPHYFKCNNYGRGSCTSPQHIHADLLEQAFIERLTIDSTNDTNIALSLTRVSGGAETQKVVLQSKLERAEHKLARVRDAYLNGAESVEDYKEIKQKIDAELAALHSEIDVIAQQETASDAIPVLRNRIAEALKTLNDPLCDIAQKYDAANSIVEKCLFDKASHTLSFTYRLIL